MSTPKRVLLSPAFFFLFSEKVVTIECRIVGESKGESDEIGILSAHLFGLLEKLKWRGADR